LLHSSLGSVVVGILVPVVSGSAEIVSNRVEFFSLDGGFRSFDDLTILHVLSTDFNYIGVAGTVLGNELSDNCEFPGRVNSKVRARTEEIFVSKSVWREVTSRFVTDSLSSSISTSTLLTFTSCGIGDGTGMGSDSLRGLVGFPDVHLHAASTVFTLARVRVIWARNPSFGVGFTTDELNVLRALSIAVSSSIVSSSLVARVLTETTIGIHLGEVESSVKSTGEFADIDVEGEFLVLEVELHVVVILVEEESARPNVLAVRALSYESEGQ